MSDWDDYKEAVGVVQNHAMNYSNLIIGSGYAGFFALWALTREHVDHRQAAGAALCMSISISIFVAFEITKMVVTERDLAAHQKALSNPETYSQAIKDYRTVASRVALRLRTLWACAFYGAVVFACFGAAIIMYAFIKVLVCGG